MAGFLFWCGFLLCIAWGVFIFAHTKTGRKFLKD
jgi:hypothetical protein